MYYLKVKDQKYRARFKKLEAQLKLKKFITINLLSVSYSNSKFVCDDKHLLYYQLLKKKKKRLLTRIVRRCILTNRSKSIQFLKVSRIQSKELISLGVVPGYKKAVW